MDIDDLVNEAARQAEEIARPEAMRRARDLVALVIADMHKAIDEIGITQTDKKLSVSFPSAEVESLFKSTWKPVS